MFSGQVGTPFDHPEHGESVLIDLPIAQDKLAEFIGTSRESVNRHFSDLKSEGFVDMHERKIVLTPAFVARYITKAPDFAALPANPAPREFRAPLMRA
jgi:CRP/FNR family transcriptional regulator